jgi:hypothetical protein
MSVCGRDDEIDGMKHAIRIELEERIRRDPERIRVPPAAAGRFPQS